MSANNLAGYEASAGTDLMVIRYDYRPMTFAKLERHSNVTQCFVPLDDGRRAAG